MFLIPDRDKQDFPQGSGMKNFSPGLSLPSPDLTPLPRQHPVICLCPLLAVLEAGETLNEPKGQRGKKYPLGNKEGAGTGLMSPCPTFGWEVFSSKQVFIIPHRCLH